MTASVETLAKQVQELGRKELAEFRAWFLEFDADEWDKQIEEDVKAGRLDALMQQALDDYKRGLCTDL